MKKAVIAAAGVAVLAAGGWSAVWYTGRGEIEARVAAEAERLRAAGYEVDYTGGTVGGYPLAWEARFEDVHIADPEGRTVDLPWLLARAGVESPGRVAFRFPEAFTATLPMPPEMAEGHEAGETLAVDVEADDLVLTSAGPDGAATTVDAAARSMLIVSGGAEQPLSASVEFVGLDASFTMPNSDEVGEATMRAAIDRLEYAVVQLDPSGMRTVSEGISDKLMVSGKSDLLTREDWQRFIAGENSGATLEGSWQAGETISQIKVDGSALPPPAADGATESDELAAAPVSKNLDGIATQSAGTSGGLFRLGDGRIEVRLSAENNRVNLAPVDEAAPVRGQILLDSLETVYMAPILPSEEMTDFTIRVAAQGLEIDDSFWALVDPGETLERGRADMAVEVSGTGRLIPAVEGEPAPTGGDRIELGNVEIAVAEVSALGASVEADGAIEFLQPLNLPNGRITVKMRNLIDLAQRLQALGLIDEQTFQMASLMASVYTKEGESADERVSEIVFADSGVTINDLPVR